LTAIAQTATLPVRSRRAPATSGIWLDIGEPVRYQGLGAGRVIAHEIREFRGTDCTFAVIRFPHREMTAQIPLGSDGLGHKLRPVAPATTVKKLLAVVGQKGSNLSRTWDDREEAGSKRLRDGSPHEWAEMLRDYAWARRGGMSITSSDADLVRETIDLLAAEYACAADVEFDHAWTLVNEAYNSAAA
jgi:RNA polymerase-interacting CarD/CdnL/TRCF family regulator